MQVELLHNTPLFLTARAIRHSRNNFRLSDSVGGDIGEKDLELIKRVGMKLKHKSVLEHCVLIYEIEGISRALLQELARHRIASYTVKSTRYTLKELKDIKVVDENGQPTMQFFDYFVTPNDRDVERLISFQADLFIHHLNTYNKSNDISKYAIPEALKTSLQMTINLRSLENLLELRLSKDALWEFRVLVYKMFDVLSNEIKEVLLENNKIKEMINEFTSN